MSNNNKNDDEDDDDDEEEEHFVRIRAMMMKMKVMKDTATIKPSRRYRPTRRTRGR